MDRMLRRARALYQDRQRIALAALLVAFAATSYVFYHAPILKLGSEPPASLPQGWVEGFEVVYSFNTVGFVLAISLMIFFYAFWTWAFLPKPAVDYTVAILQGIFGRRAKIRQYVGKKFRVFLGANRFVEVACRIRSPGSGEWFLYRIESSPIDSEGLQDIALRHGMHVHDGRLQTWVSNDELHHRLVLLASALSSLE
ncbi:MAG: hypothetical protein ACTSPE_07005 [Candidatus Thorarchaeota archaeon]